MYNPPCIIWYNTKHLCSGVGTQLIYIISTPYTSINISVKQSTYKPNRLKIATCMIAMLHTLTCRTCRPSPQLHRRWAEHSSSGPGLWVHLAMERLGNDCFGARRKIPWTQLQWLCLIFFQFPKASLEVLFHVPSRDQKSHVHRAATASTHSKFLAKHFVFATPQKPHMAPQLYCHSGSSRSHIVYRLQFIGSLTPASMLCEASSQHSWGQGGKWGRLSRTNYYKL